MRIDRKFWTRWVIFVFLFSSLAGAEEPKPKIVFLGDSLTEGYGVAKEKSFPSRVGDRLQKDGYSNVEIINAGISGSTTASGESRMRWYLKKNPDIVVLALGANDGLRGLPVSDTKKNLEKIIVLAKKSGISILLAGMQMPPNYGKKYTRDFKQLFFDLARTHSLRMIPFLLEGVAGNPGLNQDDGIHPNEKGHQKLADMVAPELEKMLQKKFSTIIREKTHKKVKNGSDAS